MQPEQLETTGSDLEQQARKTVSPYYKQMPMFWVLDILIFIFSKLMQDYSAYYTPRHMLMEYFN